MLNVLEADLRTTATVLLYSNVTYLFLCLGLQNLNESSNYSCYILQGNLAYVPNAGMHTVAGKESREVKGESIENMFKINKLNCDKSKSDYSSKVRLEKGTVGLSSSSNNFPIDDGKTKITCR